MLWKIVGTPLHILGTVHLSDAPLTLDSETLRVLDAAKNMAFETSLDAVPDLSAGFYPPGQDLADDIPAQLLEATEAIWSSLALPDDLRSRRLWLVVLSLIGPLVPSWGFDFAHGVDEAVRSRTLDRAMFALEDANTPFGYMAGAPGAEQITGLARIVQRPEEMRVQFQATVDGWRHKDMGALASVASRAHAQAPVMSAGLFGARNRAWMPHLLRFARGGDPTVAVVGVLHMVGPDSLVDLFDAAGLRCELV